MRAGALALAGLTTGCVFAPRAQSSAKEQPALAPPAQTALAHAVATALGMTFDTLLLERNALPAPGPELYAEGDTTRWPGEVMARLRALHPALLVSVVPWPDSRFLRRDGVASKGIRLSGFALVGDTAVVDVGLAECNPTGAGITSVVTEYRWRFQTMSDGTWHLLDQQARRAGAGLCTPRLTPSRRYHGRSAG